jgi:hypothetical protein
MSSGDEVTAILDQLRGLLGEGTPVTAPLPSTIPADIQSRLDKLPNGLGEAIEAAITSRKSQAEITAELAQVDPSLVPVIDQSAANVTAGRTDIDRTKQDYVGRRNALAPVERTPAGQMAVLATKVAAVTDGADSLRAQLPPADLRRVLVDELARRYYQQAKAAAQGMPMAAAAAGSPAGQAAGMGGRAAGGGNPLSALSSLSSAPTSALSSLSSPASSLLNSASSPLQQLSALGRGSSSGGAGIFERTPDGALPRGLANERGLQRQTILAARAISAAFPELREIGGWRRDALKWHPNGLAIDVMIPNPTTAHGKALGDRVLAFVMAHAKRFGLDHAIWRQTMYTQGSTPRLMGNRGSFTQNHMDHVHIATSGGGYPTRAETYVL